MELFDCIILKVWLGAFALYFLYAMIRMVYDEDYRKRTYEKARQSKQRRRKSSLHDPLAKDMYGNPLYPAEYKRAKRKEYKRVMGD